MVVKTAIIPVAGRGTRMMPLTLHQPKGMITLVDRPLFHHVIDEMISSGIEKIILVLGPGQDVFKNYIDHLKKIHVKTNEYNPKYDKIIWDDIKFCFVYQNKPLGDGDAILKAKKFIKKGEPFVVAFSDDIFFSRKNPLNDMKKEFQKRKTPILLLERIPKEMITKAGIAKPGAEKFRNACSVLDLVEKPQIDEAPSDLMVVGRYILTYEIFDYIRKFYPFNGKEIKIAYALGLYLKNHSPIWGVYLNQLHFDCGSKEGLIEAQAHFSFNYPQVKIKAKKLLIRK
jgi:UTP--glucose-1-phosphate uridylyltransferase